MLSSSKFSPIISSLELYTLLWDPLWEDYFPNIQHLESCFIRNKYPHESSLINQRLDIPLALVVEG